MALTRRYFQFGYLVIGGQFTLAQFALGRLHQLEPFLQRIALVGHDFHIFLFLFDFFRDVAQFFAQLLPLPHDPKSWNNIAKRDINHR